MFTFYPRRALSFDRVSAINCFPFIHAATRVNSFQAGGSPTKYDSKILQMVNVDAPDVTKLGTQVIG